MSQSTNEDGGFGEILSFFHSQLSLVPLEGQEGDIFTSGSVWFIFIPLTQSHINEQYKY